MLSPLVLSRRNPLGVCAGAYVPCVAAICRYHRIGPALVRFDGARNPHIASRINRVLGMWPGPLKSQLPSIRVGERPVRGRCSCIRRFQLRARIGRPWQLRHSPLTDPTVQISTQRVPQVRLPALFQECGIQGSNRGW